MLCNWNPIWMCIYFYEWLWRRLHFDNVGECYGRKKKLNINHISFVSAFTVEWIEYSGKLFPHWNVFSSESISCGKQIWQTICRSVIACVLVCVQKCYRKYSGCQMCMWINNNLHFSNLLFFFSADTCVWNSRVNNAKLLFVENFVFCGK